MRYGSMLVWVLLSGLAAIQGVPALAQGVDAAPARILLGFEGGSSRPISLQLAERTRAAIGRPVIVEEKPGASGRIAAMALKSAPADGLTVALFPIVVPILAPLIFKDVNYNTLKDFAPVSQIATYSFAFAVAYDHPAKSFPEFVAWLKTHPSGAFYGTAAAGGLPHFLGVMISRATGVEMSHVAYKGPGPMTIDVAGGTTPSGISVVSDLMEMHRAKRIRIIAVSATSRLAQLPDVPTFIEQGYPTVQARGWVGVFAPARTPKPVIDQWSAAIVAAVRSPEFGKTLSDFGLEPTGTTPEEFTAIVAADAARWAPVIAASGFRAD